MGRISTELEHQAELEGYKPNSPGFKNRLLALKVERCRDMKGKDCCMNADAFYMCDSGREWSKQLRLAKDAQIQEQRDRMEKEMARQKNLVKSAGIVEPLDVLIDEALEENDGK